MNTRLLSVLLSSTFVLLFGTAEAKQGSLNVFASSLESPKILQGGVSINSLEADQTIPFEEIGVIGMRVGGWDQNVGEISAVYYSSPAYDAGIRVFDKIIAVNGVPFKNLTSIKINGHKCHKELVGLIDHVPIQLTIEKFSGCPKIQKVWVERCSILELPIKVQKHYRKLLEMK